MLWCAGRWGTCQLVCEIMTAACVDGYVGVLASQITWGAYQRSRSKFVVDLMSRWLPSLGYSKLKAHEARSYRALRKLLKVVCWVPKQAGNVAMFVFDNCQIANVKHSR